MFLVYKFFGKAIEVEDKVVKDVDLSINKWQIKIMNGILVILFLITLVTFVLHLI